MCIRSADLESNIFVTGAGAIDPWLRACVTLAEDSGYVSNTYMVTPVLTDLMLSSGLYNHQACENTHTGKTLLRIK